VQSLVWMSLADFAGVDAFNLVGRNQLFPRLITFVGSEIPALNRQFATKLAQHPNADPSID
jgi:hypothetical protein